MRTLVQAQAAPPAGPGGSSGDEIAAMKHENASLRRRMAGFEQQIDQLRASQKESGVPARGDGRGAIQDNAALKKK